MRNARHRNRNLAAIALVALVAAVPAVNAVRSRSAAASTSVAGDGTTSATAGASCWGIKAAFPASPTGTYWLNSAALLRPQQFACDMVTNGGGWVLIGRGRDGWNFQDRGQGSPASVRDTTSGTGAFSPATLPTSTVTGLLNGTALSALPDGIRVARSSTADGSKTQDVRLFATTPTWTWALQTGQILDHVTIDGRTYAGSNTYDTMSSVPGQRTNGLNGQQGLNRLFTWQWVNHAYHAGFSYGTGVSGSSSGSSYLWTATNEGNAIPFAQVWIRPQIANSAAGFTPIPASGYPAAPLAPNLKDTPELAPFGVVGLDHTNEPRIEPYKTSVLSMRVAGDTTFVGGRFTGVQQGPSASPVAQPYLAAFDLDGNWRSSFRPQLDGRVWDMITTADGKLVIAGDFTNVNGAPNTSGMAKLDPATGQVDPTFKANFTKTNGARPLVRALAERDGVIYAAGNFTSYTGGAWNPIKVSSAISLQAADGQPGTWRPRIQAQAVRIRVTDDGSRVLMTGYFNSVNGDTNQGYFAITDLATGNPSAGIGAWTDSIGSGAKYQQATFDLGDGNYLVGGSEHDFQKWDRQRTALLGSTITKQGGDTQAIEKLGDRIYFGCHCGNNVYEGTNNWSNPSDRTASKPINRVAAVDPATMSVDTTWLPSGLKGASGEGIWTIDHDNRGCLWVGGDLYRGSYSGNAAADWLGGFGRFCPTDSTAPSAPSNLQVAMSGSTANLAWNAAADASGTVSYDVYRDDRVIATVYSPSFSDPDISGSVRYTVRATDSTGNRSAAPAPVAANGVAPRISTPVAFGATWRYRADGADLGTAWQTPGFADGTWASGPGRFGWGTSGNATDLGRTHPLTSYFRTTFPVADASQVKSLVLSSRELQGAVLYLNGVEAGRVNMASGPVTAASTAAGYLTAAQEAATTAVTVPASLLVNGTNTLAVEVHQMRAGSSRAWFDLEASLYGSGADTTAPTAPTLTAAAAPTGGIALGWTGSSDDTAVGGYLVQRDGATATVVGPTATAWTDAGVDTTVSHTYQVVAFDTAGNQRPSNTVTRSPQANPNLLAMGSNWHWTFPADGAPVGWNAPAFDDSTWASGPGQLGFGDGNESTVISTEPAPRPLTAYFRTTVDVANPAAFSAILADVVRDDGMVLYVNGVEVARDNMPAGPIAYDTAAASAIDTRAGARTPVRVELSPSAFTAGTNTIAVEVHGIHRWTGDLTFNLQLTGRS